MKGWSPHRKKRSIARRLKIQENIDKENTTKTEHEEKEEKEYHSISPIKETPLNKEPDELITNYV
jgi:hypothetical protein